MPCSTVYVGLTQTLLNYMLIFQKTLDYLMEIIPDMASTDREFMVNNYYVALCYQEKQKRNATLRNSPYCANPKSRGVPKPVS